MIRAASTARRTPEGVATCTAERLTLYLPSNVAPWKSGCAATGISPSAPHTTKHHYK